MGNHPTWEDKVQQFMTTFFVHGNYMIDAADVLIVLTTVGIVGILTYFKRWRWLWKEWLTTVDHKKIGIMYIIASLAMLFRGGADGMLMRAQLSWPNLNFLGAQHYSEIFTTHGTIMVFFMAMPFIIGLWNVVVPLQIGARDVAFPYLNAISFWLFFMAAMLFNISFVIGGSPDAGWTSYPPLSENQYDPGPGENYFLMALQITGIGTIATGVNFLVTLLKMRAPGMTLMRMPMFCWATFITAVLIVFAFPVLTIVLGELLIDRLFGAHFFTDGAGGMPMMYVNLFWIWGHPEVYILMIPPFGILSEVISTFARKRLFAYGAMVVSMVLIASYSFIVWVHHFFTMGASASVNSFFSVTTMAIAVPSGIKVFNWLFTLYKGKIEFSAAMLWSLSFLPIFVLGGVTGVMLAVAPADYQYHNSYFLVAHFHYVLAGGTTFALIAGLHYWWPKMFGHKLNEWMGKLSFWTFMIGFNLTFLPLFVVGLMGMTRRMYTYPAGLGWGPYNFIASIGSIGMGIGFLILVYNIYWSARFGERDLTGDPWDGRTLEWSMSSPAPEYNFARIPTVTHRDQWWMTKYYSDGEASKPLPPLRPIHMPNNSNRPFVLSVAFFLVGFGGVFEWYWMAIPALLVVLLCLALRSFEYHDEHYVSVEEIERTEAQLGRL